MKNGRSTTKSAYKLENEEWKIDNEVLLEVTFNPFQNITSDLLAAYYAENLDDEIALEMLKQDFAELEEQTFTGHGEVAGEINNYVFFYTLTVKAKSPQKAINVSVPIVLFREGGVRNPYQIYVNLEGEGVNASIIRDTGRSTTIRFAAAPEAGGIASVEISDENGNLLYERKYSYFNVETGVFGFNGETSIFVVKTRSTGTQWTLTATNVWGATTTMTFTVKPYAPPPLTAGLDELAYILLVIIIAAIFINTLLYLFRRR